MKKRMVISMAILLVLCLVACSPKYEIVKVTEIGLAKDTYHVKAYYDDPIQLYVDTVTPVDATNKQVVFSLTNPDQEVGTYKLSDLVSVTETGLVTFTTSSDILDTLNFKFEVTVKSKDVASVCDTATIYVNYEVPEELIVSFKNPDYTSNSNPEFGLIVDRNDKGEVKSISLYTEPDVTGLYYEIPSVVEVVLDFDTDEFPGVKYYSSNKAVATVSDLGEICAIAAGSTEITIQSTEANASGRIATYSFVVYVNRITTESELRAYLNDTSYSSDSVNGLSEYYLHYVDEPAYLDKNLTLKSPIIIDSYDYDDKTLLLENISTTNTKTGTGITFDASKNGFDKAIQFDYVLLTIKGVKDSSFIKFYNGATCDATVFYLTDDASLALDGVNVTATGKDVAAIYTAYPEIDFDLKDTKIVVDATEEAVGVKNTSFNSLTTVTDCEIEVTGNTAYGLYAAYGWLNLAVDGSTINKSTNNKSTINVTAELEAKGIYCPLNNDGELVVSNTTVTATSSKDVAVGIDVDATLTTKTNITLTNNKVTAKTAATDIEADAKALDVISGYLKITDGSYTAEGINAYAYSESEASGANSCIVSIDGASFKATGKDTAYACDLNCCCPYLYVNEATFDAKAEETAKALDVSLLQVNPSKVKGSKLIANGDYAYGCEFSSQVSLTFDDVTVEVNASSEGYGINALCGYYTTVTDCDITVTSSDLGIGIVTYCSSNDYLTSNSDIIEAGLNVAGTTVTVSCEERGSAIVNNYFGLSLDDVILKVNSDKSSASVLSVADEKAWKNNMQTWFEEIELGKSDDALSEYAENYPEVVTGIFNMGHLTITNKLDVDVVNESKEAVITTDGVYGIYNFGEIGDDVFAEIIVGDDNTAENIDVSVTTIRGGAYALYNNGYVLMDGVEKAAFKTSRETATTGENYIYGLYNNTTETDGDSTGLFLDSCTDITFIADVGEAGQELGATNGNVAGYIAIAPSTSNPLTFNPVHD